MTFINRFINRLLIYAFIVTDRLILREEKKRREKEKRKEKEREVKSALQNNLQQNG